MEHLMTVNRSFKRLVRARMAKTGESYAAARGRLLGADKPDGTAGGAAPVLATADQVIRERTGRGWEEWFDLLDGAGMADRPHREIARWVAEVQGVVPLAWTAQAVTVSYERARGGRAVGQQVDGFSVSASRTLAVPPGRAFEAFVDERLRDRWLGRVDLRTRTATRPRSVRFDWGDDGTRVNVTFEAKGEVATTVTVAHVRLPDQAAALQRKLWWRERLAALKADVESVESARDGGAHHA
jgi:hypothetical protein